MTTKAQLVIDALRTHGPSTCNDLAPITGLSSAEISNMLREYRRNKKYGVVELGRAGGGRGSLRKVAAVDEAAYADYMTKRAEREATQRPPVPKRKKYNCPRPVPHPVTGFCTRWQPDSPYFREPA